MARHDSQLSLLCNLYKVMICKLFTNLLEYTLTLFHLTEQIGFVYVRAQTTKLVQASLFVIRQVGTSTAQSARRPRHVERVET